MTPARALIIGDPHADPRYDNDRFRLAGETARKFRVDHVYCTGDWTDFESLLDHGTALSQEGLRYQRDVEAGNDALVQFDRGLRGHPCEKHITLGNHDERPDRRAAKHPELEGKVSWTDVRFREHGWAVTRWRSTMQLGPFTCSHHFETKSGRPMGGVWLARRITQHAQGSAIVGHDHRWQLYEGHGVGGSRHTGIVAGTLVHPDMRGESWCRGSSHDWAIRLTIVEWDERGRVTSVRWEDVE